VAGVVGGIAEYFDRDPTLLRVLYVLLSVISAAFPGIFVYVLLWIIIPERDEMGPGA
jgi:phage shock protein C